MASSDKVKVAVRVRPFNRREMELGTKCCVDMENNQTILYNPLIGMKETSEVVPTTCSKNSKTFAFDHCFWSMADNNPKYASQEKVFNCLGRDLLTRAFEGYNACIFAYGQTGSGKSYSMMGTGEQTGIIPRLCDALFEHIGTNDDPETSYKVEVSYMEIYNEKVRDLLDPKGKHHLKVREHNILGPYVDGLSTLAVSSFEDIDVLMCEGNKSRTVAATNMNSESSRSHAVFNIILTQTLTDLQTGVSGEKVSKISLVDLAGSERAQKTGAVGERLKEGSSINKSLTTLGLVISALADQVSGKSKAKFVPYRDSVLTWLLKDNLGGNSKTVMIATLSPAADNYEETLSTLRYADRAKRIVNHAVVNEDPNARIIRELREEVDMLRKMLSEAQSLKSDDLRERLEESEKLMKEMGKTWEEKLKETERIHQERHAALEKMGISVQTSGIKVEQGRYYLVNLNADPSLNELLVYYLKERSLIGRPDASTEQDIQLLGLGIMSEHCIVTLEGSDVYLTPLEGARTCVNGRTITSKTKVKHGDRIVWGNNHFFRINCPKANSPSSEGFPENIDYDFAQQELMLQQMGNDPIQEAISQIEKQHEEDKQEALEKQKQMYEKQMQVLRNQLMSPSTPSIPYPFDSFSKMTPTGSGQAKYQQWARDREKLFRQSLAKLKEEVVRANKLVREANDMAREMGREIDCSVTLQIPAANLSPNRRGGAFLSEPAILVKYRSKGNQVWSVEKFENKLIEMRDLYEERKEKQLPLKDDGPPAKSDPFFETQENHILIGVANIFLEALFFDTKLEYHVPIISQQGEVAGRLHIELSRVSGKLPERLPDDASSESGNDTSASGSRPINIIDMDEEPGVSIGSNIVCQVMIREARGLPPALSHFVFCQYTFWCYPEPIVVPPVVGPEAVSRKRPEDISFYFDHTREFTVHVTDEFVEHCMGGALSIEVWGHRSAAFSNKSDWEIEQVQAKSQSIMDRWGELTRKLEMWVEVHELNEQGEYVPVEVVPKVEVPTGGVYQLRQGHSRRILVQVKPVQNSGTLPIICESINHISIGGVCARSKLQKGLDSYQEEDLTVLREKWSEALEKRREYLDEQLQKIMNKEDKTEADVERERSLIDQWVCLTEERNAVLVPAVGSSIPGAPADWEHPLGMEQHIPVVFLDLNAEDMTTPNVKEGMQAAGMNSILPKEHGAKFFTLPFVKNFEKDVSVLVSWDSSVHDSVHLNRVTPNNERVYLILKAVVQLSHPASMEIVLRKRVCINVYKRQSITEKLKRRIGKAMSSTMTSITGTEYFQDMLLATGVTYEIVSNIPKASEDLEDRESLAQIAASQNDQGMSDGETYIEKYIKGVSAVESILALDRLRQDVAIKETLAARGRPLRKATSVPNIHNILTSPQGMLDQVRSDSTQDLSFARGEGDRLSVLPRHLSDNMHFRPGMTPDGQKDFAKKDNALLSSQSTIPFGIGPSGCKTGISPVPSAKHIKPMTTLIEEQAKPLMNRNQDEDFDEDEFSRLGDDSFGMAVDAKTSTSTGENDEFQDFHTFQVKASIDTETTTSQSSLYKGDMSIMAEDSGGVSRVSNESPMDALSTAKTFTPSLASSGYGSQAISTQTLSSEDSNSVQSINVDDMNDLENKLLGGNHHIKKSNTNEGLAEDMNAACESSVKLNRSDSLIDADVPADLRSPMKPTTPYSEQRPKLDVSEAEGDLEAMEGAGDGYQTRFVPSNIHVEEDGGDSAEMIKSADEVKVTKDVVSEDVGFRIQDVEDSVVCRETSASEDAVPKSVGNVSLDFYSESAMSELEGISESHDENATFSSSADVSFSTPVKNQGTSGANHSQTTVVLENSNTENCCTKKDDIVITKAIERHHAGVTPTIDVGKSSVTSGSKPRLRGGDKVSGRSAPLKATYRPASMNLEVSGGAGEERGSSCEDLNSDNDDTASMCSFGSHADLHRLGESPIPSWVQIGEPVIVLFTRGGSKTGIVQYTGTTEFAAGNWVGVELDTPDGKNDGYVKGIRYFRCRTQHGVFVRHDKLIQDKKRKNVKPAKVPTNVRRSSGNLVPATGAHREKETSVSPANSGGPNVNAHQGSSSLMKPTAASSARHK